MKPGFRIHPVAEGASAFLAAVAFFLLTDAIPIRGDVVLIVVLGGIYVYVVFVAARWRGPLYAVPLAIAGGLGFDSFYIPPYREFGVADWQNWLVMAIYISLGVLIGVVGAHSQRRGEASDLARGRLLEEQAALRRVATLVAQGARPDEVFGAVAREVGQLLAVDATHMGCYGPDGTVMGIASWSRTGDNLAVGTRSAVEGDSVTASVLKSGRPKRIDSYDDASGSIAATMRRLGIRSSVGVPIAVQGRPWGVIVVSTKGAEPLPEETEARTATFTELVATAIANTNAQAEVRRLAEEQAALRRVATLVARESPPAELFAKVVEELAKVFGEAECLLFRDEGDGTASVVALWGGRMPSSFPVGTRLPTDGDSVTATVLRHGRPHRVEDYSTATGTIAQRAREHGARSAVGCPIRVRGRIWGAIGALRYEAEPFPPGAETRMAEFAELVATAIANAAARSQVEQLAEEQAALRRVATLVAQEPSPDDLFAAVAEEACRLLGVENTLVYRYEADGTGTVVAAGGEGDIGIPIGTGVTMEGESVAAHILRTGRAARLDDYANLHGSIAALARSVSVQSAVGGPIVFEGKLWGAMVAVSRQAEPLPLETESRIGEFTQLVATAISNADARGEVARLAEEQAALRRLATLVARGAYPAAVLEAVATETAKVLAAETVSLMRYRSDETAIVVAQSVPRPALRSRIGLQVPLDGENVVAEVLRTGAPARIDDWSAATGPMAEISQESGVRASVGVPIFVEGSLWGLLHASWLSEQPPSDTEQRMEQFAELVDTAIANAESRDQLTASRARVLAAGDDARRRVVRDLHDGAQQRLVHTIVTLKLAQRALRENRGDAVDSLVGEGLAQADEANSELRELAHGILPSVLTRGGLRAGVSALVSRIDLPVEVQVPDERFPAGIEASAYFVVAEALTNVVKHSGAVHAEVSVSLHDGELQIEVHDDGVGGAVPEGSGLVGLHDRIVALGGRLRIESPARDGTLVAASLPLPV